MVTTILTGNSGCRGALDYSERKVDRHEADVVMVNHIFDWSKTSIYYTFDAYENNPAVRPQTMHRVLHLAVNPSVTDRIDEAGMKGYASELMDALGFHDQPWVMYRHRDIEREHYHIVACRVQADGSVVNDSYIGYSILAFNRGVAEKYGFTVGLTPEQREERRRRSVEARQMKLSATGADKVASMEACFTAATQYEYDNMMQFQYILSLMNLQSSVRKDPKSGRTTMRLRINDGTGVGPWMFLQMDCYGMYQIGREMSIDSTDKAGRIRRIHDGAFFKARESALHCLSGSQSLSEFSKRMDELGYSVTLRGGDDYEPRSWRGVKAVLILDRGSRSVWDTRSLSAGLAPAKFAHLAYDPGVKADPAVTLTSRIDRAIIEGAAVTALRQEKGKGLGV